MSRTLVPPGTHPTRARRAGVIAGGVALVVAAALAPGGAAGAAAAPLPDVTTVPESETGSYIVVMKADPLVATEPVEELDTPAAQAQAEELVEGQDEALEAAGLDDTEKINTYTVALNGFSAAISQEEAEKLAARKDVALVIPDELQQPQTDTSPQFLGLTARGGAWARGLTGEGVVVGVIDTGIWPEHPSFADDGSYPAPPEPSDDLPCEFGNTEANRLDAPYVCSNKLIGARQMLNTYRALVDTEEWEFDSARDDNGHGTHTASTAAGNRDVPATVYGRSRGTVSGIAPRAHIVAYKALGAQFGLTSDLAAAIDQAVADGVDVINYSIGGGASLTDVADLAFLFAADAGVWAATSAGNAGPGPGTIGGPASVPWITSVAASTQRRFFQGRVVLGNGEEYTGASITPGTGPAPLVDAAVAGDPLCNPGELDPLLVEGAIVLCQRGEIARVDKGRAVREAGGVGMILFESSPTGDTLVDLHWVPTVHVDAEAGAALREYVADEADDPTATLVGGEVAQRPEAPVMADFSSRGSNVIAEDIIKPDLTAPGVQILAGNTPVPNPASYPGELFQAISGTSMSSPHVAGVFALLRQAHPDWSAAMAKSAVMTTAYQDVLDSDLESQASPFVRGSGHLDPGQPNRAGSAFRPGLVYDTEFNDYLGFLCDADPTIFVNAEATCTALAEQGVPTEARNLNYPSIGIAQLAGEETVTRTVTSVASRPERYRAHVEAPEGFDVTVSPSSFVIRPGESVTYTVTIRNASGPVDEWVFGSLTWRSSGSSGYEVYSPIAVRGQLFAAPEEVEGSGVDGSASFQVQFGYTGEYAAAAHGLVPATETEAVVEQDPDQTFDPADGFSNTHEFTLDGAAHFRVAIPPEATEPDADLDVYVTNPDGELVAQSTASGTDELIDISLPADGTWTVWVHGWAAPGGDSPYTLYTWVVPAEAGTGNLTIDSAPTEAVLGEVATIDVSWTGAAEGQWHLGAVSHSDADSVLGLTLVEVDNR